ncbi:ribosomal RNA processing protein 1 homolog [Impatiens glandulifera]|uniref:ribosomal RNA processing protein 1 homolog n=1 Tax=Impatiens glandulifera TaxID=253017 RepID=UPI001FB16078|nr:ribosomal RNA processing protein 1 homolog [Impatiens glandulifera]
MNGGLSMEIDGGGEASLVQPVSLSLIKRLASCDKSARDRALKKVLRAWLPSQQPEHVSDDELKKLWKGLFYCVWHADKAPVQLELINRLSALIVSLPLDLSLRYFSMFLITLRREWTGIDHLRLDKFYLLIRRFVNACFRMLKGNSWDLEISRRFMSVLEQDTFSSEEYLLGSGVNYHIASVFLDELKQYLPLRIETLDVIYKPFIVAMTKSHDKLLVTKIASNMFNVLLKYGTTLLECKRLGGETSSDARDDVSLHGTVALKLNFSAKFYDSGSSPDCFQGNRKVLFGLHQGFMELEKDLTSFGIEIPNPDVLVDEEDSIPKLIPILSAEEANEKLQIVATTEHLNKKRKSKKALANTDNKRAEDGGEKKKRKKNKKKNSEISVTEEDHGDTSLVATSGDSFINTTSNDSFTSNLQIQFEEAADVELDKNGNSQEALKVKAPGPNKRKKRKNKDLQDSNLKEDIVDDIMKSGEKSAKKVSFSMKNNLVWKPHCPLPPQDLRIPPSLIPRGSALKKGVSPGPVVGKRKVNQAKKRIKTNPVATNWFR